VRPGIQEFKDLFVAEAGGYPAQSLTNAAIFGNMKMTIIGHKL